MSSRRILKVAEAIREVVSMAILTDLRDPRVEHVTVTRVEVTKDLRQAKVHVSIMGDETKQNLCLHGLQSAAGFLQKKVNNRIEMRYTPRIQFELDKGVKHALEVNRILGELLDNRPASDASTEDESMEDESISDESGSDEPGSDEPTGEQDSASPSSASRPTAD